MQDIHKLAPPHLLRGRLQHAEEREEKVAERMPRGGAALVCNDFFPASLQYTQSFAHRFLAILLRLLVQKEEHQHLIVRCVGKSERRGVHPMERRKSPVRQFALQVFELNRQDIDDIERPAAPFNALGKTRSELAVTARYLQGLSERVERG